MFFDSLESFSSEIFCNWGYLFFAGLGGCFGVGSIGLETRNTDTGRIRTTIESVLVLHLIDHFCQELNQQGVLKAFLEVEMPARIVLARMELNGLGKDKLTNIGMIIIVARSVYTPIGVLVCDILQLCTYDGHSWKAIN